MTDFSRVAQEVFDTFDVPRLGPLDDVVPFRVEPMWVGEKGAQLEVWPDRLSVEVGGLARNLTHIYWIGSPRYYKPGTNSPTQETIKAFTKLPLLTGSSILTGRVTNEKLLRLTNYALTGAGWRTYLKLGNAAVLDIGSLVNCSQGEEALEQIEANSRAGTPFVSLSPNYGTGSYRPLTFDTKVES